MLDCFSRAQTQSPTCTNGVERRADSVARACVRACCVAAADGMEVRRRRRFCWCSRRWRASSSGLPAAVRIQGCPRSPEGLRRFHTTLEFSHATLPQWKVCGCNSAGCLCCSLSTLERFGLLSPPSLPNSLALRPRLLRRTSSQAVVTSPSVAAAAAPISPSLRSSLSSSSSLSLQRTDFVWLRQCVYYLRRSQRGAE